MRSPEDLLNHSTTQQDQQYIPTHHHEAAGGEIVNNPGFTGIDYETVAGDSTMADAVYHHQSVQAYSNVADGQVMAASHENVTAEDVLEAAMEGYDTNNDKRPMEDIEGDEDPNKRIRTSEILFTASKKVNNEQWESMFERLKDYKTLNGDCLVPKRYTIDPKLGTWVETQVRYAFRFACHYWNSNQVRISSFLFPFFVCLLFTESPVQASPKGNRSDHWTRNRSTEQTIEHRAFAET